MWWGFYQTIYVMKCGQHSTWLKINGHYASLQVSLVAQIVKRLPAVQDTQVWSLGRENPVEKEMATHFSILALRIPWTEEPGRLQSMSTAKSWTQLWNFDSCISKVTVLCFSILVPSAERDWGQEEKGTTEDEMAGWHHLLDGQEFGWTLGLGDGQGGLACCSPWGHKESDTTEQLNWTEPSACSRNPLMTKH